jgi:phenylpropionate dioxygenase-like ring-hydroxylating dioxygenase large terminal subunit
MTIAEDFNQGTQPPTFHKVFNNWDIVTEGWFIALESKKLKKGQVRTVAVNGQKIAFFRGVSGDVYAVDAYCPHMGVDLGLGKVMGEELRCFFHHWRFDGRGECTDIPCGEPFPSRAHLNAYAIREKYGHIWVWPDSSTIDQVLEVPGLEGKQLLYKRGASYERTCHYHITMINGIDPQHLRTVHNIHIDMELAIDEVKKNHIQFTLKGKFPDATLMERVGKFFLGEEYSYSMKYADGCLAALTMMKGAKLFGRFPLPELYMLFAYSMLEKGRISVVPIYVNEKGKGVFGYLRGRFLLWLTKRFFMMLQGEDGKVYENIRFNSTALLKLDAPVARYIGYINRLKPSIWSKQSTAVSLQKTE